MEKKILPIVVIYCCPLEESVAYQTFIVKNGIDEFVVYDNSPATYVQDMGQVPPGAHYCRDIDNGGLSKAYNYGAQVAQELGFGWVLLLDQDTHFPPGSLSVYEQYLFQHCLLAPCVVLQGGEAFSPCIAKWSKFVPLELKQGEYSLFDYCVINSGCCVPVDLFQRAGGYKEDVRLDFSDYQFQRRLRKVEPRFYVIPLTAQQDFSNDETRPEKLMKRFELYLDGALHCDGETCRERLSRHVHVFKHLVSLTWRTRSFQFLVCFLKKYIFHI